MRCLPAASPGDFDEDADEEQSRKKELEIKFKDALTVFSTHEGLTDVGSTVEDPAVEKATEPFVKSMQDLMKEIAKEPVC